MCANRARAIDALVLHCMHTVYTNPGTATTKADSVFSTQPSPSGPREAWQSSCPTVSLPCKLACILNIVDCKLKLSSRGSGDPAAQHRILAMWLLLTRSCPKMQHCGGCCRWGWQRCRQQWSRREACWCRPPPSMHRLSRSPFGASLLLPLKRATSASTPMPSLRYACWDGSSHGIAPDDLALHTA